MSIEDNVSSTLSVVKERHLKITHALHVPHFQELKEIIHSVPQMLALQVKELIMKEDVSIVQISQESLLIEDLVFQHNAQIEKFLKMMAHVEYAWNTQDLMLKEETVSPILAMAIQELIDKEYVNHVQQDMYSHLTKDSVI